MSIIQELLEKKEYKIFFQMGGQGSPWYKELKKFYDSSEFKDFFSHCFEAIQELKEYTKDSIAMPEGLEPEMWLKEPSRIPSEDYLSTAGVSLVMIQMTQLAYYEQFRSRFPFEQIQPILAGATGHSQGLISSTLLSLGLSGNEYYSALRLYMKYIIYLALRAQEAFPYLEASREELQLAEELGLKEPSPMVVLLGGEHQKIEELVQKTNEKLTSEPKIYIGLYNTPTNRVLSSYRKSLLLFYKENKDFIESNQIKFIFLKTTCPFHSPYMEESVSKVLEDMQKENFIYDTKDLKIPVYTFADGKDYRDVKKLLPLMTRDLLVNTLHWDYALQPISRNPEIQYGIDFGPGKTSQRLSTETLQSLQSSVHILSLANPKDIKRIF